MIELLYIEWLKLKRSKAFWVFASFFVLFLLSLPVASKAFIDYLIRTVPPGQASNGPVDLTNLPIFDFVDLWQNLTWTYKHFSILLGFLIVVSVCNEYNYGTIKQNVIDGWSRKDFLHSKLAIIFAFALVAGTLVLLVGLLMGALWSPVKSITFIVMHMEYVGAYMIHLVAFLLFCFLIAVLFRKAGLALIFLVFYVYILENIAYGLLRWELDMLWAADYLPVKVTGALISFPFGKYALQETQTSVSIAGLATTLVYAGIFYAIISWRLRKKDLV